VIVQNGKNGEWFGKMALHKGVQDVQNGDEQLKVENGKHKYIMLNDTPKCRSVYEN